MADAPNLRLVALDEDDLNVISAYLQDAVLKVADMSLANGSGKFAFFVNRFAREAGAIRKGFRKVYQRRRSAVHFDRVVGVRSVGIDRSDPDQVLSLLAVHFEPDLEPEKAPAGEISLVFASNAMITLQVECVEARLTDLGPAWSTPHAPRHPMRE
jgi:hypothetical protein